MTELDDPVRRARAYLLRVVEPPSVALSGLVDEVGPVKAAGLIRAGNVHPAVLEEVAARRHLDRVEQDFAVAAELGARLVVPEDDEWPAWPLLCLSTAAGRGQRWARPPLALWVRGPHRLADAFDHAVAVVGARGATAYGEHVAADFGYGLARDSTTVVSGAAYGIDGAAHRGALAAEGMTVAVLGCGLDAGYPAGHVDLLGRIAETGLVISEYSPGTPPGRHRFIVRNRLIAALSAGTVVVEAGVRSGARNTAASAAALGKMVLAVPGPITSVMSIGCHELLRTGAATLAASVADIQESVGRLGTDLTTPPESPTRPTDGLSPQALRVHESLAKRATRSCAQISVESGVPLDRVRALLPELELTGLAERCEGGWRRAG